MPDKDDQIGQQQYQSRECGLHEKNQRFLRSVACDATNPLWRGLTAVCFIPKQPRARMTPATAWVSPYFTPRYCSNATARYSKKSA